MMNFRNDNFKWRTIVTGSATVPIIRCICRVISLTFPRFLVFSVIGMIPFAALAGSEADSLEKMSIEELMASKVVSATRSEQQVVDTAAAAYVISQDDIRRSGATTIPEALRMVPGLHVARISPTKWAISTRGFNGLIADKILVLMDGRSLYSPIHKGVYWEIQDRVLDDIDRIEVIRGPGASVWGANAVNGVINIITKHSADTQDGSVNAYSGDKHGVGLRKGWQFSDQGYARIYGKFHHDDNFDNRFGNDAGEEWTSGRGGFRTDWANADGKHALMLQGDFHYGIHRENSNKNLLYPEQIDLIDSFALNRVEKAGGNVLARWNFNPSLSSRTTAQMFYDTYRENQDTGRSVKSDIFDIDFQHVLAINEAHEFTWGLNYRFSLVNIDPSAGGQLPFAYFDNTFENHRFGVFLQDKWRIADEFELTFGSKFEHHNNQDFEFEPSLRVLWKPASQHRIWAGISRAVRLPAVSDLPNDEPQFVDQGVLYKFRQNENFRSDAVLSYELGYRYWRSEDFSLDLAFYYNQHDNTGIANSQFIEIFPDQNIKKNTTMGMEATMIWRPTDWSRLQFSTSLMDFDIQEFRVSDNINIPSTFRDPRFLWSLRSSFDIAPDLEADLWFRYSDAVSGVLIPQATPSYFSMDARLAWRPIKNLELAFIANNINDSSHPEFYEGFVPNPLQVKRTFWLQGNIKF